ncbi:MAG: asparagine synthase C-terminal domain-containing protein [Methanomicrobiales archaeon]|nr:asparagine synthase C-terminal domain-containing protein [Methanomicrobiales archaeon]MDI6875150.1 asparagine synthase C-terminal domain-containing protein [Methanomicrobiales archaeon]
MRLIGWVEVDGRILTRSEVEEAVASQPGSIRRFGGEFFLAFGNCQARDRFGIVPGSIPPGSIVCDGRIRGEVDPAPEPLDLETAICTAVNLRSDEGIVAFSGGLDSSLIARLAGLECVTVGIRDSHDLLRGKHVADRLGLPHTSVAVLHSDVEAALHVVVRAIPSVNPLTASIATTLFFVARHAAELGYRRVLTGQGADELFGGYSRYLRSVDLEADLERDFLALQEQVARDQAVARLHGVCLSLPYMDVRVVRAARAVPAEEKIAGGFRKIPLRIVAERHLPSDIAWYEKKAMQYGSGIWPAIRTLARRKGHRTVARYLGALRETPPGDSPPTPH